MDVACGTVETSTEGFGVSDWSLDEIWLSQMDVGVSANEISKCFPLNVLAPGLCTRVLKQFWQQHVQTIFYFHKDY